MNIRKNIDYSEMYTGINQTIAVNLSQMELYLELGRLVNGRPEKGAAVMAASISPQTILIRLASPLAICAGCGTSTGCMKDTLKCWNRL